MSPLLKYTALSEVPHPWAVMLTCLSAYIWINVYLYARIAITKRKLTYIVYVHRYFIGCLDRFPTQHG
jgi:hypothetical protein